MRKFVIGTAIAAAVAIVACTSKSTPSGPSPSLSAPSPSASTTQVKTTLGQAGNSPSDHNSAAHDDKGYIDGWYNGQTVQLYYTKSYYCEEPPASAAPSGCEIGADALTP